MGKGLGFIVRIQEGDEGFGLEGSVSSGPFDFQGGRCSCRTLECSRTFEFF